MNIIQIKTVFNSLLSWSLCYAIRILQIYCKFSKLNFLTESFEMKREIIRNSTSTQMRIYMYRHSEKDNSLYLGSFSLAQQQNFSQAPVVYPQLQLFANLHNKVLKSILITTMHEQQAARPHRYF